MEVTALPKQQRDSVCDFCEQNMSCEVLHVALKIAEKEVAETGPNRSRLNGLKQRLNLLRFGYPNSQQLCWLSKKKGQVQRLVDQATEIFNDSRLQK